MANGAVLSTKVRCPPSTGLVRDRLLGRVPGRDPARLTVVIAQAGCGKTTLLARLASLATGPTGWYRAEPGDASEAALATHLASALPGVSRGHGDRPVQTADDLLRRLDEWSGAPALLVVDDVHHLAGTPAERALGRVVDLAPPQLRVALGSRRRPSFQLSRLQVSGQVHELDGEDLRFRAWEVERLFRDVYAEPLPPETVAVLTRRTGGWAAGLQLFHLATGGKTTAERRAAVDSLSGRTRLIRSYLAENVLAELRPGLRTFLTRTSSLGLLSGQLCDALLDTSGSQALLQELEGRAVFTSSPDGGLTFRYHQVLQDHLEAALLDELGGDAPAWYRHSAGVLHRAGHVREAVRAYACAEDWGAVAQVLTRAGGRLVEASVPAWDELLPAAVRNEDPWLTVVDARRLLRSGDLAAAVEGFRRAETLAADAGTAAWCRSVRALASAWLADPLTGRTPPTGQWVEAHWSQRLRAATLRIPPARLPAPAGAPGDHLAEGLIGLLSGDLQDGTCRLRMVADAAPADSFERIVALTGCALAELLTADGGADRLEEATLAAEVAGFGWLERLGRSALLAVLSSDPDPGATGWAGVVEQCRADGDRWGAALLLLLHGGRDVLGGGPDAADTLLEAAELFRELRAPVLGVWAQALRALALDHRGSAEAPGAARAVETAARTLGVGGARGLARAVLDRAAGSSATPLGPVAPGPSTDRTDVRLGLLGGFRLEVAGRPVPWLNVRPRVLTLLRMLCLSLDVDVHREGLIDALWPDVPVEVGTHRLQVALSSLRRALDEAGLPGAALLARRGEAYRLSLPPGAVVDVRELAERLAEAGRERSRGRFESAALAARRGLDLYRGDLLPGDGPAEWVVGERDRLRVQVAGAARELAEDCLVLGDLRAGIEAARRSLELDAFQDAAWHLLADLHQRAGDRAAAAHARRQHSSTLAGLAGLVPPARPGRPGRPGGTPRPSTPVLDGVR
ncbi:AAA family ATPase [Modestobacter sp. URMC 112]